MDNEKAMVILAFNRPALELDSQNSREIDFYAKNRKFADGMKIVAIEGGAEDWAAYIGPIWLPHETIAQEGDKLGEETATLLFPSFASLLYRR